KTRPIPPEAISLAPAYLGGSTSINEAMPAASPRAQRTISPAHERGAAQLLRGQRRCVPADDAGSLPKQRTIAGACGARGASGGGGQRRCEGAVGEDRSGAAEARGAGGRCRDDQAVWRGSVVGPREHGRFRGLLIDLDA